jgi:hypothetical protein
MNQRSKNAISHHPRLPVPKASPRSFNVQMAGVARVKASEAPRIRMILWRLPLYVVVALISALTVFGYSGGAITTDFAFVVLTCVLLSYLGFELYAAWRTCSPSFLLCPPVLTSLFTFGLGIGITNFVYFLPALDLQAVGLRGEVDQWMLTYMSLSIVAAMALWIGFWSGWGAALASWLSKMRFLKRVLRKDYELKINALLVIALVAICGRLLAIQLGVYGFALIEEQAIALAQYREYLAIADGCGKLALVAAALYYSSRTTFSSPAFVILCLIIGIEVLFGFASGFKSQVVMPFMIVGLCIYFNKGRVPAVLIVLAIAATFVSYLVIEPFRAGLGGRETVETGTLDQILGFMFGDSLSTSKSGLSIRDTLMAIAARLNLTYIGSVGIEYADQGSLPPGSPDFLGDILTAPWYAYVPRFLWESKPQNILGNWYYTTVLGFSGPTSVAMSPITYLYFAGGGLGVALGFFAVGFVQRSIYEWLVRPRWSGGAIIFFGLLTTLMAVESSFNTFFVAILRYFPLLVLAQYVLFRR